RERGDDDGREGGLTAQIAHGVAKVAREVVAPRAAMAAPLEPCIDRAKAVAHRRHAPEFGERRRPRRLWRHSLPHEVVDAFIEMEAELVVDVRLDVTTPKAHVSAPRRFTHRWLSLPRVTPA